MHNGPNLAPLAALMGDPARARMLTALIGGRALTASELAHDAGVTLQTASSHLSKLRQGKLIEVAQDGRHRYFRLSGPHVAQVLESLHVLAAELGDGRVRTGPKEPAMRKARMCYDHLAGDMGVRLYDSLAKRRFLDAGGDALSLTTSGKKALGAFGVDIGALESTKRPMCRACLDWSVRRNHLAGSAGAALAEQVFARGWARREKGGRTVHFTDAGERAFFKAFPL